MPPSAIVHKKDFADAARLLRQHARVLQQHPHLTTSVDVPFDNFRSVELAEILEAQLRNASRIG